MTPIDPLFGTAWPNGCCREKAGPADGSVVTCGFPLPESGACVNAANHVTLPEHEWTPDAH